MSKVLFAIVYNNGKEDRTEHLSSGEELTACIAECNDMGYRVVSITKDGVTIQIAGE